MTEENLLLYELMVIIHPELGEENTSKQLEKIKKFIKDLEGKITHEDIWGIRTLAYTIKKQERGFYVVLNFNIDPEKIQELKGELALEQDLLRYMILKTPKYYEITTLEKLEQEADQYKVEKENAEQAKEEDKPKPVPAGAQQSEAPEEEKADDKPAEPEAPSESAEPAEEPAPEPEVEDEPETQVEPEPEVEEEESPAGAQQSEAPEEEKADDKPAEPEAPAEPEPEEEKKKEEIKIADRKELDDVDAKLRSIIDDPDISL